MLDDIKNIENIDEHNVVGSIAMFPDQCQQAWDESQELVFPKDYRNVENIIVCGMGGSSFTPKTIKELYWDKINVPYEIVNGYDLPKYASDKTLVILSSYSGSTEEVLSCFRQAKEIGTKITVVTKGGELKNYINSSESTGYIFEAKNNPSGQPRVGAGYMLFGHLGILYSLGFIDIDPEEIYDGINHARNISKNMLPSVNTEENPAKKLALTLKDTHPFLIAAEHLRGYVNGFANQINETAKMISDYRYIPELNHHLMEGLKNPSNLKENILFVFFKSDLYRESISLRFDVTKEVVKKQNVKTHQIILEGDTKLKQVLEGFTLSGYTTLYLATLYQQNPGIVPWVDYFKSKLKDSK